MVEPKAGAFHLIANGHRRIARLDCAMRVKWQQLSGCYSAKKRPKRKVNDLSVFLDLISTVSHHSHNITSSSYQQLLSILSLRT